eukprot:1735514-Amphidinium_carterae.1
MHVVCRADQRVVTLDNRRLAVYKMAYRAGKCGKIKVQRMDRSQVSAELKHKSDSTVQGTSVKVRGTKKVIHMDGSCTETPKLTDGQLQHRADAGAHWSQDQRQVISSGIQNIEAAIKDALGGSAKLVKAGSFMKGTDIAGESDIDVMVFGCHDQPISEHQWDKIVSGIKAKGYEIQSVNPRCIHVKTSVGPIAIEFDVVAHRRKGFPPNAEPTNPFKDNLGAARAVRNIKLDFTES